MKTYVAEKKKVNKGFVLSSALFPKMTLEQMEQIKEGVPEVINDRNFISFYFQKSFEVNSLKN
jgi:hypothetical protein